MIKVRLWGRGHEANISKNGEVVTRAFDHSDPVFQDMDLVNTAYNFFKPKAGHQFVITTIIASADRDVGVNGTTIDIYEATTDSETTIDKSILRLDMAKSTQLPLIGLDLLVNSGRFINAKHDDDDVLMTIAGYFIPA